MEWIGPGLESTSKGMCVQQAALMIGARTSINRRKYPYGRDRSFFFVNYEGLLQRSPSSQISTIPDERFRAGDFSGSGVIVNDPLTGLPFPGNRIPAGRIDPAAARIM